MMEIFRVRNCWVLLCAKLFNHFWSEATHHMTMLQSRLHDHRDRRAVEHKSFWCFSVNCFFYKNEVFKSKFCIVYSILAAPKTGVETKYMSFSSASKQWLNSQPLASATNWIPVCVHFSFSKKSIQLLYTKHFLAPQENKRADIFEHYNFP